MNNDLFVLNHKVLLIENLLDIGVDNLRKVKAAFRIPEVDFSYFDNIEFKDMVFVAEWCGRPDPTAALYFLNKEDAIMFRLKWNGQ